MTENDSRKRKDDVWEAERQKGQREREEEERKGGKSIIERWLLQARTPASQDQTWRPQRERPAGTASGGGCQGLASGGSSEGSLQHSRPCLGFGCFPPSLPGSCLCLLVTYHCISASQNLYIIYQTISDRYLWDQFRWKFCCPKFVTGNGNLLKGCAKSFLNPYPLRANTRIFKTLLKSLWVNLISKCWGASDRKSVV